MWRWIALASALGIGIGTYIGYDALSQPSRPAHQLSGANGLVDLYSADDPRLRLLYFGYTRCPDVCPTSLAMLAAALKSLPEERLEQLWPVFITLDPARDDAAGVAQYAHYFHPALTGLSGTPTQIEALAKHYGVIHFRTELEDSAMEYAIDHSSYFYLVRPDGTLIEKVSHTLDPAIIRAAIERNLAGPAAQGVTQ